MRSNVITSVISTAVITAPDFYRATIEGSISWSQLTKNLIVNASGVAGGVVGGLAGALLGGTFVQKRAKAVLDEFVEDDAKQTISLAQSAIEDLQHLFKGYTSTSLLTPGAGVPQ